MKFVLRTHVIRVMRKQYISEAEPSKFHVTCEDVRIMQIEAVPFKESCSVSFCFYPRKWDLIENTIFVCVLREMAEVHTVWQRLLQVGGCTLGAVSFDTRHVSLTSLCVIFAMGSLDLTLLHFRNGLSSYFLCRNPV